MSATKEAQTWKKTWGQNIILDFWGLWFGVIFGYTSWKFTLGIQGCFCLELQRFEGNPRITTPTYNSTSNRAIYYNFTGSSSLGQDEFKLCNNFQTWFGQYSLIYKSCNMIVSNCCWAQEEWQTKDLHWPQEAQCNHKKGSLSSYFKKEVIDVVVRLIIF